METWLNLIGLVLTGLGAWLAASNVIIKPRASQGA